MLQNFFNFFKPESEPPLVIDPIEPKPNKNSRDFLETIRGSKPISKEAANLMEGMEYCQNIFDNLPDEEKKLVVRIYKNFNCRQFSKDEIITSDKQKILNELIAKKLVIPFRPSFKPNRIDQTPKYVIKSQYTNILFEYLKSQILL